MVTCLQWNSIHLDLFAVGYGSYNFNEQTNGIICIYSLKSTVYPEKIIKCESGVMSMSFHPKIKLQTPKIIIDDNITPQDDNNIIDEINNENNDDDDENMLALCSCFDFNPFMKHLYLIGTEDGHIIECNKTYNDGFTKIYKNTHYMNIYCIKWNPFHDKIFLTCSEDWTIKLWEINQISSSSTSPSSSSTHIKMYIIL